MKERGIKQGDAWATWKRPDNSRYAESKGAWIYYRKIGQQRIEVVAKKNERSSAHRASGSGGEWIVLSVWSKAVSVKDKKKVTKRNGIFQKLLKFVFGR